MQPHVHYARLYLNRGIEEEADVAVRARAILDAFRNGDGEAARDAMVAHLKSGSTHLLTRLPHARARDQRDRSAQEEVAAMDSFGHSPFLDGKVAIVTGARRATALPSPSASRARRRHRGIDINAEGVATAATGFGDKAKPFVADCADVAAIRDLVRQVQRRFRQHRHPRKQCRHPPHRLVSRHRRSRFRCDREPQPERRLLPYPGGPVGAAARRPHRQHRFGRRCRRPHAVGTLCRDQGGLITITKTLARALARARYHRQCGCPRPDRHARSTRSSTRRSAWKN